MSDRSIDIPKDWKTPIDAYGARGTVRIVGAVVVLVAAAPWLVSMVTPWTLVLIVPLLGGAIHKLTILAHDCSHRTLFRSRKANRIIGEFACILLGTSFDSYTRIHWAHHRALGHPDEPQAVDYVGINDWPARKLLWHLFQPLVGFSAFKLFQFNGVGTTLGGPLGGDDRNGLTARRVAVVAAMQIVIALVATGFGKVWWLFPLFPFTAITFGLFFSRLRSFAEHSAFRNSGVPAFVRTHKPNMLDAVFMFDLNFNYHVEHHVFPQVPSHKLPEIHHLMKKRYKSDEDVSPSTLRSILVRLEQARQPSIASAQGYGHQS